MTFFVVLATSLLILMNKRFKFSPLEEIGVIAINFALIDREHELFYLSLSLADYFVHAVIIIFLLMTNSVGKPVSCFPLQLQSLSPSLMCL